MSRRSDWLPTKRAEQLNMARMWLDALIKHETKWEIPKNIEPDLLVLTEIAEEALGEAKSAMRNPHLTTKCKEAFDNLIGKMRFIKDRYFKTPPLIDSDYDLLGLKPKDTTRTPINAPKDQATAIVHLEGPSVLMLHIQPLQGSFDEREVHGFKIHYGILPPGGATPEEAVGPGRYLLAPPKTGEDLPLNNFSRRRRVTLIFSPKESGKTVFFSIRCENAKGEAGPWGPLFSSVIP